MKEKTSNLKKLRSRNRIRILKALWNGGAKSRLELAKECTLTAAAVSVIAKDLLDEGMILEIGAVQRNASGRKEVLLDINYRKYVACGVNIESDNIHFSVCTGREVLREVIVKTDALRKNGFAFLKQKIAEILREAEILRDVEAESVTGDTFVKCEFLGIGVGVSGAVDEAAGVLLNSYGVFLPNFPLKHELEKAFSCNVSVRNNIRMQCASLISDDDTDFLYIKHSPGLGCAAVSGGKIVDGANHYAGEIGHTVITANGKQCKCGKRGCLESYVSESAILEAYEKATRNEASLDNQNAKKTVNVEKESAFFAAEVYAKYRTDKTASDFDKAANEVLDDCVQKLAVSVANAAVMFDPNKIILAGGIFKDAVMYEKIKEAVKNIGCEVPVFGLDSSIKIKAVSGAREMIKARLFGA